MSARSLRLLARGVLVGEALSWPNALYRMRTLPAKRLARMETLAAFARLHATSTPAVPYAHSSPPETLRPGAGEASEWFAFTAATLQRCREAGDFASLDDAWRRVADAAGAVRIGTRIPLGNIRGGLVAPQSGNDNPHYFDDLPMIRAVAAAGVFDDESTRRTGALRDAAFTASEDGLWCAEATATLFSHLLDGQPMPDAIRSAVGCLPHGSWSGRLADAGLTIAAASLGPLDRSVRLADAVEDHVYSYAVAAPETLACLLSHLSGATSAHDLMLGVLAQPRRAATLPALAGAAAAVCYGTEWMPAGLDLQARLPGVSIPAYAGVSIAQAIDPVRR